MQREKTYEELLMENKLLREVIDNIHEGVYIIDDGGKILLFNDMMEQIEGLKEQDVVGQDERTVYDFLQGPSYNQVVTRKIKKTGEPQLEKIYSYNLPDGRTIHYFYNAYPFYYEGKLSAIYSIGRNVDQIGEFLARTIEKNNQIKRDTANQGSTSYFLDDIVGGSGAMREAVRLAHKVAPRPSPILIYGKTGTGKELFAQGIHNASLVANGPFVPVNCAAIPETLLEATLFGTAKGAFTGAIDLAGLFEQANGGTIFLDEINSMPQPLQAKLLRVLQEKVVRRLGGKEDIQVNCRVISACNQDPFDSQNIRSDFLFRISTVIINIPPLRERAEDIEELSRTFIQKHNRQFGLFVEDLSPALLRAFEKYNWPGNVRELENMIETAMNIIDPTVTRLEPEHLPLYLRNRLLLDTDTFYDIRTEEPAHRPGETELLKSELWRFEKRLIEHTLRKNGGSITKAANELGIWRQNLHYRINRFGIQVEELMEQRAQEVR